MYDLRLVWVKAPAELSEADMTLYPEPHNARAVVRDSCGRRLPAHAIAQTLSLSVMSPSGGVKLKSVGRNICMKCFLADPWSLAHAHCGDRIPRAQGHTKDLPQASGLPGLQTTLPRPRRPGECRLVTYQRFEPLHERGEAVPRLI